MYTIDVDTSVSRVYGYSIIVGFGTSLFAQASFSVAQATVKPEFIASAVGFITYAQVSGITIANSVFLNKSQATISAILPDVPISDIQATITGAGSAFVASLSNSVKTEVLAAIVTSMSKTYILVITAGALTTVLSFAMKRERLFMVAGATA